MEKSFLTLALTATILTTITPASAQGYDGIWDKDRWQIRGRVIGILADGDWTLMAVLDTRFRPVLIIGLMITGA